MIKKYAFRCLALYTDATRNLQQLAAMPATSTASFQASRAGSIRLMSDGVEIDIDGDEDDARGTAMLSHAMPTRKNTHLGAAEGERRLLSLRRRQRHAARQVPERRGARGRLDEAHAHAGRGARGHAQVLDGLESREGGRTQQTRAPVDHRQAQREQRQIHLLGGAHHEVLHAAAVPEDLSQGEAERGRGHAGLFPPLPRKLPARGGAVGLQAAIEGGLYGGAVVTTGVFRSDYGNDPPAVCLPRLGAGGGRD
ncbi:hypothetical protein ON010_g8614 [Phytophthora cinnamomi]|nr:hypothetical protein ON010_g8614 [Phytophthora cinnamomi]